MIFIYNDGIHNNISVQTAVNEVTHNKTAFCNDHMIRMGCLDKASLLIIPGGADLYFCEKMNGECNEIIKAFITNGGSYLGICAGAYYACSSLNWNDNEICGTRELALYKSLATGPVPKFIENSTSIYNGSWIKAASINTNNGDLLTFYNGGPVFNEPADNENTTIIARYNDLENTPPAIVSGNFGKGKYILSSSHIEKFGHLLDDGLYKHLNNSYEREREQIDLLLNNEAKQKILFKDIIDLLL